MEDPKQVQVPGSTPQPSERYPGSLIVDHIKEKYYEWRRRRAQPKSGESRCYQGCTTWPTLRMPCLDFCSSRHACCPNRPTAAMTAFELWLVKYEGLMLVGILGLGLAKFAAEVYIEERCAELSRCASRGQKQAHLLL